MVSTAISLKEALFDIATKFENLHPGVHIVLNGASSGELALQIQKGAPVDIFVSASSVEMKTLERNKLLAGTPKIFAYNRLVLVSGKSSPAIESMSELPKMGKIAIGNPETVPAGRYAVQALEKAGILSGLKEKHALIYGYNARALLTYVEQENVSAAFVYYSDAISTDKVSAPFMVPKNMTDPIAYEIAAIQSSEHKPRANEFIKFASSEENKSILTKHHFENSWN